MDVAQDQISAQRRKQSEELVYAYQPGSGLYLSHAYLAHAKPLPQLSLGEASLLAQ